METPSEKYPCGIVPLITAEAVKLLKYEQVFLLLFPLYFGYSGDKTTRHA